MLLQREVRITKAKPFQYIVTLGNTRGDTTSDADAVPERVADESRVAVRALPFLNVPANVKDYLDVTVSHVEAFDRVYVQLANEVSTLTTLNERLQRWFTENERKRLINPCRGQLCAVRCGPDQRYYRAAVIVRPDPVDVELYCVDYGMKITLPVAQIVHLADEFLAYAPQAIAIQIKGVAENSVRMTLDTLKMQLEKKSVTVRLEAQLGDKYLVSMTINDEKGVAVDMLDILAGRQRMPGGPSSNSNMPPSAPNRLLASPTAFGAGLRPGISGGQQQRSMMTDQQLVGKSLSSDSPTVVVSRPPKIEQALLHTPECSLYPSPPLSVQTSTPTVVSKIDSPSFPLPVREKCLRSDDYASGKPSRFYIQLERFIDKVLEIKAAIKTPTTPLREPTIGTACIARYDGDWYRAEVLAINGETVTVQYVDYGNVDNLHQNEVFAITDEQPDVIRETHKCAIPCKLAGIEPADGGSEWSSQSVDLFNAAFPEVCVAEVDMEQKDDQMYLVNMKVDGISVSESLLAHKAAKTSSDGDVVTKIESGVVNIPLFDSAVRSDDDFSGGLPLLFYIQLGCFIDKVQQMLTDIKPPTVLLKTPTIGAACIGNFSDGWYRGEIVAIGEDLVTVRYVDYGNTEDKQPNQIYAITDDQSDFVRYTPKLAFPCKVLSVEGKEWSPSSLSPLVFSDDGIIRVHVKGQEGEILLVDVMYGTPAATDSSQIEKEMTAETSAASKMEPESGATAANEPMLDTCPPAAVTVTKLDQAVVSVPLREQCWRSDNNKYAPEETVAAHHAKDLRYDDHLTCGLPSHFYIQLSSFVDKVQQVSTEIKQPTVALREPTVGMACIAKYEDDWYRAEVVYIYEKELTVQYVDFGNLEVKRIDDLFAITDEQPEVVRTTPKLAIPCKLIGIRSVDGRVVNGEMVEAFHKLFPENGGAQVDIKEQQADHVFSVDLAVGDVSSVIESLVAQKVAKHVSLPHEDVTKIDPPTVAHPVFERCIRSDLDAASTPSRFYVQLQRFGKKPLQMLTDIVPPTSALRDPTVGMGCIASFLGDWYRAEVIAVDGETVTVQYVDYGNLEEKKKDELFAITNEQPAVVRESDKLAIPCKLVGVEPMDGGEWSAEALSVFRATFPEMCAACVNIVGQDEDQTFLVELEVEVGSPSVAEQLVAQNVAKLIQSGVDRCIAAPPPPIVSSTAVSKLEAIVVTAAVEAVLRSDGDTSESPSHFSVQLERFVDKLLQVLTEIKQPTVLLEKPTIGMACIANFLGDWYRAEVISVDGETATVQYVDYGNVEEKKNDELFAITDEQPEAVRVTHKLAIPCKWFGGEEKKLPADSALCPFKVAIKGKEGELLLVELEGVAEEAAVMKIEPAVIALPVEEMCARSDEDGVSESSTLFYVQLSRFAEVVQQMIGAIKPPTAPLHDPSIGTACIASFLGDWYRAEIVAVGGEAVTVQYVDYGNTEEKKKDELFAITDEQPEVVRTAPKLAIPCKLVGGELETFPEQSAFLVSIKEKDGELFVVEAKKP